MTGVASNMGLRSEMLADNRLNHAIWEVVFKICEISLFCTVFCTVLTEIFCTVLTEINAQQSKIRARCLTDDFRIQHPKHSVFMLSLTRKTNSDYFSAEKNNIICNKNAHICRFCGIRIGKCYEDKPSLADILSKTFLFISSPDLPDRFCGSRSRLFNGYPCSFPAIKLQDLAEVKNEWSHTSTPPIRLHGVDRKNFTLFNLLQHS